MKPLEFLIINLDSKLTYTYTGFFDFFDVDDYLTTADLSKVYVRFSESDPWVPVGRMAGSFIVGDRFQLKWDSSQVGKTLVLRIGREYRYYGIRSSVYIVGDYTGYLSYLTQLGKLTFDANNYLRTRLSGTDIMLPVDIQGALKGAMTLYSGTVTASGNTADIDVGSARAMEVEFKVTSVSGTSPTLDVYLEGKFERSGDYKPLVYQTGITTTGVWYATITQMVFRYVRVRWVVGGTSPSFALAVYAQWVV
jgi:hypothetical protein